MYEQYKVFWLSELIGLFFNFEQKWRNEQLYYIQSKRNTTHWCHFVEEVILAKMKCFARNGHEKLIKDQKTNEPVQCNGLLFLSFLIRSDQQNGNANNRFLLLLCIQHRIILNQSNFQSVFMSNQFLVGLLNHVCSAHQKKHTELLC